MLDDSGMMISIAGIGLTVGWPQAGSDFRSDPGSDYSDSYTIELDRDTVYGLA